ncbi:MAG: CehA/McbA family metallohydrolase [Pseudomonadota bacterium]
MMLRLMLTALLLACSSAQAEWTHSYPLIDGFGHHVYFEGFELPILNAGPTDAAPSPDGTRLALAARGWIWVMDLDSGIARRVTDSAGIDARPAWSPESDRLVFVRDYETSLHIILLDMDSGEETRLTDSEAVHLDPVFSADGSQVFFSSSDNGPMDLWVLDLDSGERRQVTPEREAGRREVLRRPRLSADGTTAVYLDKRDTHDSIRSINLDTGEGRLLIEDSLTAQADMALSPDGRLMTYVWPYDGGWELRLMAVEAPHTSIMLTQGGGMPLSPTFSADGTHIYFSEADDNERKTLYQIPVVGGPRETVTVKSWDWGVPVGRLQLTTGVGDQRYAAVRMNVIDGQGHPVAPESGAVRKEMEHNRVFFYSSGFIEIVAPAGPVTVTAVQGFETAATTQTFEIRANETTAVNITLGRLWDASELGWYSADTHFHLNYGGPYRLDPEDIVTDLRAEGLDLGIPLLANLHNRFLQQDLWGWQRSEPPLIIFGQEVRSHFLGHVGLFGMDDLFWPWIWGPYYEIYSDDDRLNAEALRHARDGGGLGGYVHPVAIQNPLTTDTAGSVPIAFVADAVQGEVDLIELACLWTDEIGTGAVWHQVLNLGIPLAATGGSDVMNNYYRTMPVGATRVYVKPEGEFTQASFQNALRAGRSVISNGPMLDFQIAGSGPGEVITPSDDAVAWTLTVHSVLPLELIEFFVNGERINTIESAGGATQTYSGQLRLPSGGWVTARVTGVNTGWPAHDSYLYAETSPIWIGEVGSTDPDAAAASASTLMMLLDNAQQRLRDGYGDADIPRLEAHFEAARNELESMID